MKQLTKDDFVLLSFPDTDVLNFSLDVSKKVFSVKCSDGWLDTKQDGKVIHEVELQILGFDNVHISEFANENTAPVISYSEPFALKDICEFSVDKGVTVLKGFSKQRGYWTEYVFSGGDLAGRYRS
jgi:hypothetical protein